MDIGFKCCCDIQYFNNLNKVTNTEQEILSILKTVYERCKAERDNNCLLVPLQDYHERVSNYTAYPKTFIYTMLEENQYQEEALDIYDHILFMECINFMYSQNNLLTFNRLYEECVKFQSILSENYKLKHISDLTIFIKKLHEWGYVHRKLTNGSVILMENPKTKFARFNYLNKIRDYRAKGRQIYYLDERQILKDAIKKYKYNSDENIQVHDGFLYFHILTRNGYENGLFTCQDPDMTFSDIFKKWMIDIVLYSIKPMSVIVMENNVLHGLLPNKSITRYHTKNQMLQWLRENNIPCNISMPKPILYDLIEKCTFNNINYEIDCVFKSCGHDILRLPNTFTSLTPTTYFWNYLCKNFKIPEDSTAETVKHLLSLKIKDIDTTAWPSFIAEVVQMENDIYEIDALAENLLEEYELDSRTLYE
ncbi:uncharacterized protein LOC113393089 [Vanessa tameamea]|uniref:Uncharacterized protein LOC113393089 n=1 Tax=Vanessa tameamea TaxID=334116 RepID=A0A8B8HLH3_VANTA